MISSLDFMKNYRTDTSLIYESMSHNDIENLSGDIMKDLLELKEKVMFSEAVSWGTVIQFILNMIMKLITLAKGLYKILERFFGGGQPTANNPKNVEEPINAQTINIVNNYYQSAMRTAASVERLGDTIDPTANSKVTEENILQYMDVNSRSTILDLHKELNNNVMSRIDDLEDTLSRFRIPTSFENRDTMNTLLNYIEIFSKVFEESISYVEKDDDNKSQIFADVFAKRVTLTPLYKFTEKLYMDILKCQLPIIATRSYNNDTKGYYIVLNSPLSINEDTLKYIDEQNRIRKSTTESIMNALFDLRRETIKINNYDFSKVDKLDIQDIYTRLSGYLRNKSGDKVEFIEVFKSDAVTIRNTITELEKAKKNIESMKDVNTKDMKEFVDSIMGLISVTLSFASLYTCITSVEKNVVLNLANWEYQMFKTFIKSVDKVSYDIFKKHNSSEGGI